MDFDGYGIGGALEKHGANDSVGQSNSAWNKPRHLLGISEPDDILRNWAGIIAADCVSPTRVARNGAAYTPFGQVNAR